MELIRHMIMLNYCDHFDSNNKNVLKTILRKAVTVIYLKKLCFTPIF